MRVANKTSIQIDPKKLEKKMDALGKPRSQIAREMGYSQGFLFDAIRRERISESAAKLLEMVHGIKTDDIVPDRPIDLENNPPMCADLSADKLYTIIYNAVYHAVEMAIKQKDNGEHHESKL